MSTDYGRALLHRYGDVPKARDTSSYQRVVDTWFGPDALPSQAELDADDIAFLANEAAASQTLQTTISNDNTELTALNSEMAGRALLQQVLTTAPAQLATAWNGLTATQRTQVALEAIYIVRNLAVRVRRLERMAQKIKLTES